MAEPTRAVAAARMEKSNFILVVVLVLCVWIGDVNVEIVRVIQK